MGTIADDEGDQRLAAVGPAHDQQVLGLVPHRGDLAERRAVGQPRGQADQLVVVVGVGVLERGQVGHRDQQERVAEGVDGLAVP